MDLSYGGGGGGGGEIMWIETWMFKICSYEFSVLRLTSGPTFSSLSYFS